MLWGLDKALKTGLLATAINFNTLVRILQKELPEYLKIPSVHLYQPSLVNYKCSPQGSSSNEGHIQCPSKAKGLSLSRQPLVHSGLRMVKV